MYFEFLTILNLLGRIVATSRMKFFKHFSHDFCDYERTFEALMKRREAHFWHRVVTRSPF